MQEEKTESKFEANIRNKTIFKIQRNQKSPLGGPMKAKTPSPTKTTNQLNLKQQMSKIPYANLGPNVFTIHRDVPRPQNKKGGINKSPTLKS
mmetsp:Transcript_10738/g.9281  ORF Transcript_10738/g.9281 Transcript_10738/m.9281 type:complete len:92 (-) Transcript_10738:892-1167(-)